MKGDHIEAILMGPDEALPDRRLENMLAAFRETRASDEEKGLEFDGATPEQAAALRRIVRLQSRWEEAFGRLFDRHWQRRSTVMKAKARTAQFRKGTPLWDPPGDAPYNSALLIDLDTWNAEMTADVEPMLRDLYVEAVEALEVLESKALSPEMVENLTAFIQRWLNFVLQWNVAVAETVRSVLESESVRDYKVEELVDKRVAQVAQLSASRTAIALSTGGVNQAQAESAVSSGVGESKRWYSARDTRVRPAHRLVAGQTVPLTGQFRVTDRRGVTHFMDYPGDISVPMDLWIGCRCVMLIITAESGFLWDRDGGYPDSFGTTKELDAKAWFDMTPEERAEWLNDD